MGVLGVSRGVAGVFAGLTLIGTEAAQAQAQAQAPAPVSAVAVAVAAVRTGDWQRAESPHFIVYSQGGEAGLRAYAETLETFDTLLRWKHGLPLGAPPPRKLEIYLVKGLGQMREVHPAASDTLGGFYSAGDEAIYAVAKREKTSDYVVKHEYVHHFMFQYAPYGYPGWLTEGYAEYFMTVEIEGRKIEVGRFNEGRASNLLRGDWISLAALMGKRASDLPDDDQRAMFYAQAWLLTHYLMSDPGRYAQMVAYMRAVGEGGDPVKAMEAATGQSLPVLEKTLRTYLRGGLQYATLEGLVGARPEIAISRLPASADALLLVDLRLRAGIEGETFDKPALLKAVRAAAARHPGDPFAELVEARAALLLGEHAAGWTILERYLSARPDDVEALVLAGQTRLDEGDADPARQAELYKAAGSLLARAYRLDPDRYQTLTAYAQSRSLDPKYPSDNVLNVLAQAQALAPQVSGVNLRTAEALMMRGRDAEAAALLRPLANRPHGGPDAALARTMLKAIADREPRPAA